jgi:hypothetical protein
LLPVLAPAARRLLGIDRSPEMLAEARARLETQHLDAVQLVRADLARCRSPIAASTPSVSSLALHQRWRSLPRSSPSSRAPCVPVAASSVSDLVQHIGRVDAQRTGASVARLSRPSGVAGWFASAGLADVQVGAIRRRRARRHARRPGFVVIRGPASGRVIVVASSTQHPKGARVPRRNGRRHALMNAKIADPKLADGRAHGASNGPSPACRS